MSADDVTLIFLCFVFLHTVAHIWLARRQIAYVGARRNAVPEAFRETVGPQAHAKAADYTCARQRFGLVNFGVGIVLLLGWTLLGGLDALNGALLDFFGGDAASAGSLGYQVALVIGFSLIGGLLELPFEWYSHFRIEQRFGFNKMTTRLWIGDTLKNLLVSALIGVPLIAMVLWLMGAAGSSWWIWAWAFWVGFNLLLMVIYPMFIAPLFNEFKPLEDGELAARVRAVMDRCGFSASGLFVMDGSKRSAESNAYFTGIGRSKRVVLYDTLIAQLSPGEIEAVIAHELGHFHHKHVAKMLVQIFLLSLLGLGALGWLAQQPQFFLGLGVTPNAVAPNDALALLLFLLALPNFTFFVTPLASRASRRHEFEADAFARERSSATDLASALVKLTEANASTLTPDPLYAHFHYSHPPMVERLAALRPAPG